MKPRNAYSFGVTLALPFAQAEAVVREALMAEKFGIISEVDFREKFREKLGIEYPAHKILGACNPQLSFEALTDNPDVALALPCNVVLRETADGTAVTAILPSVALQPFEGEKVRQTESAATTALERVFRVLTSSAAGPSLP